MKIKELHDMSSDELVQKEKSFKQDLYEMNNQRKVGSVEKPSRFKLLRRDIARIMTILKERESTDGANRSPRK